MRSGVLGPILVLLASAEVTFAQWSTLSGSAPAQEATPAAAKESILAAPMKWLKKTNKDQPVKIQTSDDETPVTPDGPILPAGIDVPDEPNAFETIPNQKLPPREQYTASDHIWVGADYLLWHLKNGPIAAPLISTNPLGGLPSLPTIGTQVVGPSKFDFGEASGGRFTIGFMNMDQTCGIEITGFILEKLTNSFAFASDANGNPPVGRPVFDALRGTETTPQVAFPGFFAGGVAVKADAQLWGAEANFLFSNSWHGPDFILGFRYLGLQEDLGITQTTNLLGGLAFFNGTPVAAPGVVTVVDRFETRNDFYGGQVGLQNEMRWGHFFFFTQLKVGFGTTHESVNAFGSSTLSTPGSPPMTVAGGLLAASGTSLLVSHDEFAVVPEAAISVGYDLGGHIRFSAGYNYLYWSEVARAGSQVNRVVNPETVPTGGDFGSRNPTTVPVGPVFRHSEFWAQGITFGVAIRY